MTKKPHPLHNDNAGTYPLPTDKDEIEAVLRSVDRCYAAHPYLAWRYDAYGEAFTRSDGGYLATLATNSQSYVTRQVEWLGDMLCSRGLPRLLLEDHLQFLYEELMISLPKRAPRYRKLLNAAERLRTARYAVIAQSDFEALAGAFETASGAVFANAGRLLVAAVCDEDCGLARSVPSLISWLGDPGRFSPVWCAAVAATLAEARALAKKHRPSGP